MGFQFMAGVGQPGIDNDFRPPLSLNACNNTASRMIPPFAICCQAGPTPRRLKRLATIPMINAPTTAPQMEPLPPFMAEPPITTAAMASSSQKIPAWPGCPDSMRLVSTSPEMPANSAQYR